MSGQWAVQARSNRGGKGARRVPRPFNGAISACGALRWRVNVLHAAPRTWPNCLSPPTSAPSARRVTAARSGAPLPARAIARAVPGPCPQPSADPGIPRGRGTGGTAGSGGRAAWSGYLGVLFIGVHRSDIRARGIVCPLGARASRLHPPGSVELVHGASLFLHKHET